MDGYGKDYGAVACGGNWIFALVIIFLAVLLVAWRRHEGAEHGGSFKDVFAALAMSKLGNGKGHCSDESFHDFKATMLAKDQAVDTGRIIHNQDLQEEKTRKEVCETKFNQERLAYEATKDAKNTKIQELVAENTELKTLGAMGMFKSEVFQKMDQQYGRLQQHLDKVECEMLKRPPVWPQVGTPTTCLV